MTSFRIEVAFFFPGRPLSLEGEERSRHLGDRTFDFYLFFRHPLFGVLLHRAGACGEEEHSSALRDHLLQGRTIRENRTGLTAFMRTALAAGASFLVATGTAEAQKQGGSITVGLELDIPGLDPLKVGVVRYLGANRGGGDLRHADRSRRQRRAGAEAGAVLGHIPTISRPGLYKLRPDVKFHDGTPFNAQAVNENFDRQEGSCQQVPLRVLHLRLPPCAGARRVYAHRHTCAIPQWASPAQATIQSSNNRRPLADRLESQGDDYNRNPVGTGRTS